MGKEGLSLGRLRQAGGDVNITIKLPVYLDLEKTPVMKFSPPLHGFTLLELLVVITAISLMIVLMWSAIESVQSTKCIMRYLPEVKQIRTAFRKLLNDYDDISPEIGRPDHKAFD